MAKLKEWILRGLVSGLVQWAFPLAGGLLVATMVGVFGGLESPWNYTLVASLGFFVLGVLKLLARRLRRGLPPPWGERVALHADLTMLARLSQALARARAVPLAA